MASVARCLGRWLNAAVLLLAALTPKPALALESALALTAVYAATVDRRLELPVVETQRYVDLIQHTLSQAGLTELPDQYLVVVDRSPHVQAVFLFWKSIKEELALIGASPVSTGRPGRFDYFETPLGIFEHTIDNLDYRAEGTKNSQGIRGYGVSGMRVFDFGWQSARQGWGERRMATMRLQMHATDPDVLEPLLGNARSKGCIRIPATLNRLIDKFGILDADYEEAMRAGQLFWMLDPQRQATPWSGRYLIVVDTQRSERPLWAMAAQKSGVP